LAPWFSFIYTIINFDIFPFCNFKTGALSKRLSFFPNRCAFFGGLPFALLGFQSELL
jgi:hypothetical protein